MPSHSVARRLKAIAHIISLRVIDSLWLWLNQLATYCLFEALPTPDVQYTIQFPMYIFLYQKLLYGTILNIERKT